MEWFQLFQIERSSRTQDISDALPLEAHFKGWRLLWEERQYDPVFLFDQEGDILYEWSYIPSLTELFETCERLLLKEVRK